MSDRQTEFGIELDEKHHKFVTFQAAMNICDIELKGRSPGRFDVVSKTDRRATADFLKRAAGFCGIAVEIVEE